MANDVPASEQPTEEQPQYFESSPTVPSRRSQVSLSLPDVQFQLATDSGVFAKGGVDPGTKLLLLDGPPPTPGDLHLADIGAGYGPIALTLAARNPEATVWAIEVNERARGLCRDNAAAHGLTNVRVVAPDAPAGDAEHLPAEIRFDRIWSNPPIRIGKGPLQKLLTRWLQQLTPQGTAHLVVQKHLGSDSLQRWLTGQGWPTDRRSSRAGYRLLDVHGRTDNSGTARAPSPHDHQEERR